MATGNHSWEELTRRLLSEAQTEKNDLDAQIKDLQQRSDQLDTEIEAFKIAVGAYLTRTGRQKSTQVDWAALLQGRSHKDKLIAIAGQNGGLIRQSQATDIIYNNRLTEAKKRATVYQMVKNSLDLLRDNGTFVKIRPGEYQLVGAQPELT